MLFPFTPFLQTLICFSSATPLVNASANASSFQFTPLFQTLIGALIGAGAAIAGSYISGRSLIKSYEKAEIEKKKLEMFGEVLENLYTPFQEIAEEIINQKGISNGDSANVKRLIDAKKRFILMCPEDIKKEIGILRENLRGGDLDEAITRIETLKRKIDELINKFVLKR